MIFACGHTAGSPSSLLAIPEEREVALLSSAELVFLQGTSAILEVTLLRGGIFAEELKPRGSLSKVSSDWELVKFSHRLSGSSSP